MRCAASRVDRWVVAEPEVRRAEVDGDERRRPLRREGVDDGPAEQVAVEADRAVQSVVVMMDADNDASVGRLRP
jgi:hypothetical protein